VSRQSDFEHYCEFVIGHEQEIEEENDENEE
jgi:hypothetical protein